MWSCHQYSMPHQAVVVDISLNFTLNRAGEKISSIGYHYLKVALL